MRLIACFVGLKVIALIALVAAVPSCATFRQKWDDDWQKYCAVPPNDVQVISCSCMNPATPGCYPIPDDDGDNPSMMAKKLRQQARLHRLIEKLDKQTAPGGTTQ